MSIPRVVAALAVVLCLAARAQAAPLLQLAGDINSGTLFCATDNNVICANGVQLTDLDPTVGILDLGDVLVGGLNIEGSLHSETFGPPFNILNSSLTITNTTASDVTLESSISADGFLGPTTFIANSGSGTWQLAEGSFANYSFWADPTNGTGGQTATDRPGVLEQLHRHRERTGGFLCRQRRAVPVRHRGAVLDDAGLRPDAGRWRTVDQPWADAGHRRERGAGAAVAVAAGPGPRRPRVAAPPPIDVTDAHDRDQARHRRQRAGPARARRSLGTDERQFAQRAAVDPVRVPDDVAQGGDALDRTLAQVEDLATDLRAAVALARTQLAALRARAEMGEDWTAPLTDNGRRVVPAIK